MDQNNWIYLVLILLVLGFGVGVVVAGRRRGGSTDPASARQQAVATPQQQQAAPAAAVEPSAEVDDAADVAADEIGDDSAEAEPVEPEAPKSMRDTLRGRGAFSDAIGSVLGRSAIDDSVWEELEDALLIADVGISVATSLLDPLRERVDKGDIDSPDALIAALRESMITQLAGANRELAMRPDEGTSIWLFVGVNGVGKTTTIGKLASSQIASGSTVLLSAGDTFRAAAANQLQTWAERSGAEIVRVPTALTRQVWCSMRLNGRAPNALI